MLPEEKKGTDPVLNRTDYLILLTKQLYWIIDSQ